MIMNMVGGGSAAKWATGTSATISGLDFEPTKIYVFGTDKSSGTSRATVNGGIFVWAEFSVENGTITKDAENANYGGNWQDSFGNSGYITFSTDKFTLTESNGNYTIGNTTVLNVTRWFALK